MWALFPGDKHIQAVSELIAATQNSERVVAIVGGSLLEDAVETTLRERLLNIKGVVDSLMGHDRALGATGPKIDLLHLLGAFDDKTRNALKGLTRIRNCFAHTLDASFISPNKELRGNLKRLALHEGRTHYPHHLFGPDSDVEIESIITNQDRFIVNLRLALLFLMRDRISHHPYSNCAFTEDQLLAKYPTRYERGPPGS
jgi:hypothetical protein